MISKKAIIPLIGIHLLGPANGLTVNTTEDQFDTPSGPELSLREAIRDAGGTATTIDFAPSLSGATIDLTQGILSIIDLDDNGFGKITIEAFIDFEDVQFTFYLYPPKESIIELFRICKPA